MLRKTMIDEPSEKGTPSYSASVWAANHRKNEEKRMRDNQPREPEIYEPPARWLIRSVVLGAIILLL